MRLNARINDNTDLVNKQFVEALLARLDDTTIADLKKAIDSLEETRQWGSFGNTYTANSVDDISSILSEATFTEDPVEITCNCDISQPLAVAASAKFAGSAAGIKQNFKQEVM